MAEVKTKNTLPLKDKPSLYEEDFVAWADEQALLLRQKNWDELDLVNLIEEVQDLGGKHRDAIESHLTLLLMHLLKWQFQSGKRTRSWSSTIKNTRLQISRLTRKHPILKSHLNSEEIYLQCYGDAREDANVETDLPLSTFPVDCPYKLTEVLNAEFFPGD